MIAVLYYSKEYTFIWRVFFLILLCEFQPIGKFVKNITVHHNYRHHKQERQRQLFYYSIFLLIFIAAVPLCNSSTLYSSIYVTYTYVYLLCTYINLYTQKVYLLPTPPISAWKLWIPCSLRVIKSCHRNRKSLLSLYSIHHHRKSFDSHPRTRPFDDIFLGPKNLVKWLWIPRTARCANFWSEGQLVPNIPM